MNIKLLFIQSDLDITVLLVALKYPLNQNIGYIKTILH